MIELDFHIPLSPEETWERLTQSGHIAKWWGEDVKLEPFKQGSFHNPWMDAIGNLRAVEGSITSFEPPTRLQLYYKQKEWPKATRVEFLLTNRQPSGTRLYLQHSGWELIEDEKLRNREVDAHTDKWEAVMKQFVKYCT